MKGRLTLFTMLAGMVLLILALAGCGNGGPQGTTGPTAVSTHPVTKALDVPVDTAISVTFSKAMDRASAEAAFSIGTQLEGTSSWTGNTMSFVPAIKLGYSTTYNITIGREAQDLAGKPLARDYSWSFTTAGPSTEPPKVVTNEATKVVANTATVNGNLSNLGTASSVQVSFQWSNASGALDRETDPQGMTKAGAFSNVLTGLKPDVTYYWRAKVVGDGTSYGDETKFRTVAAASTGVLISYHRSGGIGGFEDRLTIYYDGHYELKRRQVERESTLKTGQISQLEGLLKEADFPSLKPEYLTPVGADLMEYFVTYHSGGKKRTVHTDDGAVPKALAPVLAQLDQIISSDG